MPETTMIVTGRFQPLHKGHFEFLRHLRKEYNEHLIICILRRPFSVDLATNEKTVASSIYEELSKWTRNSKQNPLPNWQRFRLLSIAVNSDPIFAGKTSILFRGRPDLFWEKSLIDLPENRIWVFNPCKGEFDQSKVEYYKERGERVRLVDFDKAIRFRGEVIRKRFLTGEKDLRFLPKACQSYFKKECLQYLLNQEGE